MLPKNGCKGTSIPGAKRPTIFSLSSGMIFVSVVVILREEPAARTKAVVRVGNRKVDRLDAHLEHVTGIGALDVDRAGEYVAARTADLYGVVDRAQRRLYVRRLDAHLLQPRRARRDQRADDHLVARLHAKHRHRRRIVVAECDRAR